jgi:adenylyltransferase/sulfurtransferase
MERAAARYARQVASPLVGEAGQARLAEATAVVVGVGATGGVVASILARAGVGRLRVIDRDIVETTNLQRQVLFTDEDAREAVPKAKAAERALRAANPEIEVEGVIADLVPRNAERLLGGATCVFDGTDNFESRLLINDASIALGFPWVYSGVIAAHGHVLPILPGRAACFRCYLPEPPPPGAIETCDTAGVLAPAVHAVGGFAAMEGLRILAGEPATGEAQLLLIDLWARDLRRVTVRRDPACRACALRHLDFLRGQTLPRAAALCGREAVQIRAPEGVTLDLDAIADRAGGADGVTVVRGAYGLRLQAGGLDATIFSDGRAIVKGTGDLGRARAFYARFVGS